MTTPAVTRLDPMKNLMPYELHKVAYDLVMRGQNEGYWFGVPEPVRPLGRVPLEVPHQVATFAMPLVVVALAWATFGSSALLYALPVAFVIGVWLDCQLESAIREQLSRERAVDAGRYEAVKWLSEQMGMPRSEITLIVIYKMATDLKRVYRIVAQRAAQREAAQKAAEAQAASQRRSHAASDEMDDEDTTHVAAPASGSYDDDEPTWYSTGYDSSPGVNIANGLPMNGAFDTAGNAFGFDNSF